MASGARAITINLNNRNLGESFQCGRIKKELKKELALTNHSDKFGNIYKMIQHGSYLKGKGGWGGSQEGF